MQLKFPHRAYQPLPTVDDNDGGLPPPHFVAAEKRRKTHSIKIFRVAGFALAVLTVVSLARIACHRGVFWEAGTSCAAQSNGTTLPSFSSHYTLPSGDKIPSVALGVWQAQKGQVGNAVKVALKAGYRHFDGAWVYGNEAEVGQALQESSVPREEIFITSKLWNNFHAPDDIEPILDQSLQRLRTDYVDLYLIHWPIAFKRDGNNVLDEELTADPYPTWEKLEDLVDKGKIRNIGISNFNIRRIQNLTANPLKYKPAVNQVELNFWNPQPELLEWSEENGLLLEAYSPLGSSKQVGKTLAVPEIRDIACKLGITPAQVVISWHVQRGTVVLPKSVTPSRVIENYQTFELPQEDFEKLEAAATAHPPQRVVNPSKGWHLPFDVFDGE